MLKRIIINMALLDFGLLICHSLITTIAILLPVDS